jgi:pilus assembly protein CpaE
LGVTNPQYTIHDALSAKVPIESVVNIAKGGLHFIPGTIAISEEFGWIDFKSAIDALRGKYKFIIVDSAPGLGPEVVAALKASDELLIVANPDIPTIAGTLRTFRAAERFKVPVTGIVVNKVRGKKFEVPLAEIKKTLKWPIAVVIPEDTNVRESLAAGVAVVRYKPKSPAAKKFRELAHWLVSEFK